jgi:photosystem II stability/assembly factor-like uncharacterized protein
MSFNRFLILATQKCICRFPLDKGGSLGNLEQTLRGVALEAVCRDTAGVLYAGADKGEIYRSQDEGQTWKEVFKGFPKNRGLWSLMAHPVRPGEIYAGLEPVSLWISRAGGEHWEELTALRNHPVSKKWHFYDPAKPHIRTITFDRQGERLLIGIEVGGVLVSRDGGASFEDKSKGVDGDIHTLQVAPHNPDLVFAMTGDGLFRSKDGGDHWKKLDNGLDRWYMVPLAFVTADAKILCVGAGNRPPGSWQTRGADAAIYWSEDGGDSWKTASGPFPLKGMLSSIVVDPDNPDHLFAGTTNGMLLHSTDGGKHWSVIADKLPRIEEMVVER